MEIKRKSNFIEYNNKLKQGLVVKKFKNQYDKAKHEGKEFVVKDETKQKLRLKQLGYTKDKWSDNALLSLKKRKKEGTAGGGFKLNAGRGKRGWYKGYWCQSSWELAWVIFSLDHGLVFERCNKFFEYEFENKIYKYFPDFYIPEINSFIEIKGVKVKRDEAKWKIPNLQVLEEKDLKGIFYYVKFFYTNNFVSLYESANIPSA